MSILYKNQYRDKKSAFSILCILKNFLFTRINNESLARTSLAVVWGLRLGRWGIEVTCHTKSTHVSSLLPSNSSISSEECGDKLIELLMESKHSFSLMLQVAVCAWAHPEQLPQPQLLKYDVGEEPQSLGMVHNQAETSGRRESYSSQWSRHWQVWKGLNITCLLVYVIGLIELRTWELWDSVVFIYLWERSLGTILFTIQYNYPYFQLF